MDEKVVNAIVDRLVELPWDGVTLTAEEKLRLLLPGIIYDASFYDVRNHERMVRDVAEGRERYNRAFGGFDEPGGVQSACEFLAGVDDLAYADAPPHVRATIAMVRQHMRQ